MTHSNEEASPIARLIGPDGTLTVGWVYAWETSELSILWINERDVAAYIDPPICPERLAKAKSTTPDDVIAFLAALLNLNP